MKKQIHIHNGQLISDKVSKIIQWRKRMVLPLNAAGKIRLISKFFNPTAQSYTEISSIWILFLNTGVKMIKESIGKKS